jgi:hypothetical protein
MHAKTLLLGLFATCAVFAAAAASQVPADKALSPVKASDGLDLQLWASETLFTNATCLDIDHKGRVWVVESLNSRSTLKGKEKREPEGDRILILEDSKGSGKADGPHESCLPASTAMPTTTASTAYPSDRTTSFTSRSATRASRGWSTKKGAC